MTRDELFELTPAQQKAFNAIKKAFKQAEGKGLFWYNNHGTIGACDENKIISYTDEKTKNCIYDDNTCNYNEFRLPCSEWADDSHYFHVKESIEIKEDEDD